MGYLFKRPGTATSGLLGEEGHLKAAVENELGADGLDHAGAGGGAHGGTGAPGPGLRGGRGGLGLARLGGVRGGGGL